MKKPYLLIIYLLMFTISSSCAFSMGQISKKLEMKENYSNLICFDEKVIRYRIGDKDAFKIEILPDIFNDRHEMIIKPIKRVNTNLLVWTETQIYNFDIETRRGRKLTKFFNINKSDQKLSKEVLSVLNGMELDMPPVAPIKKEAESFEIDLPPGLE